MNILFITQSIPWSPRKGYDVVPFHRLRILSARHAITLACLYRNDDDLNHLDEVKAWCRKIVPIKVGVLRQGWGMARASVSGIPFQVAIHSDRAAAQQVSLLCREGAFDVVDAFMLRVAELIPPGSVPVVLDLMDSLVLNYERWSAMERRPALRGLVAEELRRLRGYEYSAAQKYRTVVLSDVDRDQIGVNSDVVPLGVDGSVFFPATHYPAAPVIVFAGNLGYRPNEMAVAWFLDRCWPEVLQRRPGAVFRIVGRDPTRDMLSRHGKMGIEVTGEVRSMAAALREAAIAVAPMQIGSGMQSKILEAMATGIPVVTTTLGLGAIQAVNGESVCLADEPAAFAGAVVDLLGNRDRALSLGKGARRCVESRYTWEAHCAAIETIYADEIERRRRP